MAVKISLIELLLVLLVGILHALVFDDEPVVVRPSTAKRMVEGEADGFLLFVLEGFVKLCDQGFGGWSGAMAASSAKEKFGIALTPSTPALAAAMAAAEPTVVFKNPR